MAQDNWLVMIGAVTVMSFFVVFCLIVVSGCQEDQQIPTQPNTSPTSIQSEKDKHLEFEQCLKAAELGDADAQFNLGNMFASGAGIKQDYNQAAEWFRKTSAETL